jgi:DNA-binding PadR family transcriptional regulator
LIVSRSPVRDAFIPLPASSLHVLVAAGHGPIHGYEIMQTVEKMTDGVVTMGPGTLYGTIKRLLSEGLLEPCDGPAGEEPDGPPRRYYRPTKLGHEVLAAELQRLRLVLDAAGSRARPVTT